MYSIDIKDALYFIVIYMCGSFRDTWQNGMFYRQQIAFNITAEH